MWLRLVGELPNMHHAKNMASERQTEVRARLLLTVQIATMRWYTDTHLCFLLTEPDFQAVQVAFPFSKEKTYQVPGLQLIRSNPQRLNIDMLWSSSYPEALLVRTDMMR